MITVSILVNGQPILTRSAVDKSSPSTKKDQEHVYQVDDGTVLYHVPIDGAVALAIKMLNTIKAF